MFVWIESQTHGVTYWVCSPCGLAEKTWEHSVLRRQRIATKPLTTTLSVTLCFLSGGKEEAPERLEDHERRQREDIRSKGEVTSRRLESGGATRDNGWRTPCSGHNSCLKTAKVEVAEKPIS